MKALINKYKKMSTTEKLIGAGIVGGAIYGVYKIFSNAQNNKNKELLNAAQNEAIALQKKYKATFQPSNYLAFANSIYEGTKYGIGDNYGAVRDVLKKMQNDLDVLLLIKAYGARQNYIFGIPQGEKRDLFTNIREELGNEFFGLSSSKLDAINTDWKKKNIKYQL